MYLRIPSIVMVMVVVYQIMSIVSCTGPVLKLVTYNAAMIYSYPLKDERVLALPAALSQLDADVICLQEVFFFDDIVFIENQLQIVYPYTYSPLYSQSSVLNPNKAPCSGISNVYTLTCIALRCNPRGPLSDLLVCSATLCNAGSSISQECLKCLGAAGPDKIFKKCILYTASTVNVAGLLLLSRIPLLNPVTLEFFPGRKQLFKKAMILTEVERVGQLVCAHLTPSTDLPFLELEMADLASSYAEQNAFEAQFIVDISRFTPRTILMGDFNAGPALPFFNVAAAFPHSFNIYISAGLESPYVNMVGQRTFLTENSIYDHVFHRGYKAIYAQRLYLNDGTGLSLSDHYGVEVWLTS